MIAARLQAILAAMVSSILVIMTMVPASAYATSASLFQRDIDPKAGIYIWFCEDAKGKSCTSYNITTPNLGCFYAQGAYVRFHKDLSSIVSSTLTLSSSPGKGCKCQKSKRTFTKADIDSENVFELDTKSGWYTIVPGFGSSNNC